MSKPNEKKLLLDSLSQGEYSLKGQFTYGSNYTFLCDLTFEDFKFPVVYKPIKGEKSLWDFPDYSLAHREVAAYLVSEIAQFNFVPPTVYREDGPSGAGSLQLYVDHDPEYHFLSFSPSDRIKSRPVALYDAITNNTDRKGGHVLIGKEDQKIWCIDHGVSFHATPKLRTVIWDFAGEPFTPTELSQLSEFIPHLQTDAQFYKQLLEHIDESEIGAMLARILNLLKEKTFPHPTESHLSYPWPPV